jgi:hypothetical protein
VSNSFEKLLTIGICVYGDYPLLISRCLDSIINEPLFFETTNLIIGANAVSKPSYREIEARIPQGQEISVIRSYDNVNKSGMRRMMISLVETPFIVSVDDDIILKPGWLRQMRDFIESCERNIDVAGVTLATTHGTPRNSRIKSLPYSLYPWRKKWWKWKRNGPSGQIPFPGGGFHLMRTEFIRKHDFPDFNMLIDHDDILLGDLIIQSDARYASFPADLNEKIIIDLTASRGDHWKG